MRLTRYVLLAVGLAAACARSGPSGASSSVIKVGPPKGGAVVVVGGGGIGQEVYKKFIELAGGPDALIIDIPTAGGIQATPEMTGTKAQFQEAGARNVLILHTNDRKIADTDSFADKIRKAGGVWFDGGRQYRLFDSYGGTKSEAAFHEVLAKGGVVGGSSAGASILGSYMVRGAPSNDNFIMAYPGYEKGFGFLRNTGIDQHVVMRGRLPDIADSLVRRYPKLLFISEDEGTAWVVQGDNAEIIGRNKAFAYNGRENDPGVPFLTLRPGDRYNLAERRVTHRASSESPLSPAVVDSMFESVARPQSRVMVVNGEMTRDTGATATVLVARDGKVLVNKSYNVPIQPRYTPTTAMPQFDVGEIGIAMNAAIANWIVSQNRMTLDDPLEPGGVAVRLFLAGASVPDGNRKLVSLFAAKGGATYAQLVQRRLRGPAGLQRTESDSVGGTFRSNVDDLYRLALTAFAGSITLGWREDRYRNQPRLAAYGTRDGKRAAFVRFPDSKVSIIILTNSDAVDASALAERMADRLFTQ